MAVLAAPVEQVSWTEALSRIPDERARRAFLQRESSPQGQAAVQHLSEQVVRLVRVDLQRALRLAKAALWVARQSGDKASKALAYRALGHVYYLKTKYQLARTHYEAAIAIYTSLNEVVERARTMTAALQSLIYLGEYDLAFEWSAQARVIFENHNEHLRLARLDTNVGNIFHRQDRFQEALDHYRRAYLEFEKQEQVLDTAIVLRNMGVCFISLNQFSEALETYDRARAFCSRQNAPLLLAEVEYNVAYLYYLRGEYARAIAGYEITRELCIQAGDPYHRALCDLDQSEMFLELNMSTEGARLAESARGGFRKLNMGYEMAKAFAFAGLAANQLGHRVQALKLFEKARNLFDQEKNQLWLAVLDLYCAVVSFEGGDDKTASRLSRAAFDVFISHDIQVRAAFCELLLARMALRAGELHAAQQHCQSAIQRLETTAAPAIACHIYLTLGQARELLRDFDGARESYETASSILEILRGELSQEDSKIAFLKDKVAVYENLVALILQVNPGEEEKRRAFNCIEKAKSRSLAELVAVRAAPANPSADTSALQVVNELRERISWTAHRLEREQMEVGQSSAARTRKLGAEGRALKRKLADALVDAREPDGRVLGRGLEGALPVNDICDALPPNTTVLEYYVCRQSLFACVLDRNRLEIAEVGSLNRIRERFRLLQFQFSKFRLGNDYISRFSEQLCRAIETNLENLYADLIAPIRTHLHCDRLAVIPHGFLHQLPFHALSKHGTPLLEEFDICFAPSASILAWLLRKPVSTADQSLVMGVADPLAPQIEQEATTVATALSNPHLFLGEAANLATLRAFAPNSRYIHIAAHGYFHQENPMFSSIRLGDSAVTLMDLYQLKLSAELVALSGCGTGLNVVVGGDELLGLVRGLLQAGAHSMLVSLWDVHDASTTEFMNLFYKNLASMTKCQALRVTALEIRKDHVHPYYWAPFVLVGKPC
jgi:tetratricopeptide (TPR) repeat protein